jgi:type I restriction enzyme M protein
MIDARNIYRKVTRKIYDFTPEQLANLTAIVWLYRGQSDRFTALVQQHLERTLTEAAAISGKAAAFRQSYDALVDAAAPLLKTLASKSRSSRGNEAQTENDQSLLTSAATIAKERDDAAKSASRRWTNGRRASPRIGRNRATRSWPRRRNCSPNWTTSRRLAAIW